ncbi:Hypp296 [Branchiostoma lanceolatum]|uniref:Hypp296 protein n=1 Tax=Branchiostoma lanceolatum TaxID=7740 RepID=A0A8J9YN34_BRALA|nr:Hypp296 [Branchiostoma lanceolatum]
MEKTAVLVRALFSVLLVIQHLSNGALMPMLGTTQRPSEHVDGLYSTASDLYKKANVTEGTLEEEAVQTREERLTVTAMPQECLAHPDYNITVTCTAQGVPKPTIEWRFLNDSGLHGLSADMSSACQVWDDGTLEITGALATSFDWFVCVASNGEGAAMTVVKVTPDIYKHSDSHKTRMYSEEAFLIAIVATYFVTLCSTYVFYRVCYRRGKGSKSGTEQAVRHIKNPPGQTVTASPRNLLSMDSMRSASLYSVLDMESSF